MVTRNRTGHSGNGSGPASRPARDGEGRRRPRSTAAWTGAFRVLGRRLPAIRGELACLAAVQTDRVRLAVEQFKARLLASILALVAVAAIFALAAGLLVLGAAGGIASALDGNVWLANLLTGAMTLFLLGSALAVGSRRRVARRRRHLEQRYARHEARRRSDAAAAPGGGKPC